MIHRHQCEKLITSASKLVLVEFLKDKSHFASTRVQANTEPNYAYMATDFVLNVPQLFDSKIPYTKKRGNQNFAADLQRVKELLTKTGLLQIASDGLAKTHDAVNEAVRLGYI